MSKIAFKGSPVNTAGSLPAVGAAAPDFKAVAQDLSEVSLASAKGKRIVLNIFPSIDTGVCAMSVRRFNQEAAGLKNTEVWAVSLDLPFAAKRFCGAEGIDKVKTLSLFRHPDMAKAYGLTMVDGPLVGLLSRAVVIVDENGKVKYTEQVPEITQEPDYGKALAALT